MNHKMITLCDETLEEASKMENFSAWVRGKLREHMQKRRPNKSFPCSGCGNFIEGKWSVLERLYWGSCEPCGQVFEWREKK